MTTVRNMLSWLVAMPIWYYLLYKILVAVNATDLMMFLFWVYMPVGFVVAIISAHLMTQEQIQVLKQAQKLVLATSK